MPDMLRGSQPSGSPLEATLRPGGPRCVQAHRSIEVLSREHGWTIGEGTAVSRFTQQCRRVAQQYAARQAEAAQVHGMRLGIFQQTQRICGDRCRVSQKARPLIRAPAPGEPASRVHCRGWAGLGAPATPPCWCLGASCSCVCMHVKRTRPCRHEPVAPPAIVHGRGPSPVRSCVGAAAQHTCSSTRRCGVHRAGAHSAHGRLS